jgi:Na+-transporting NADH:ubiquinone oxidoreductase subunit F
MAPIKSMLHQMKNTNNPRPATYYYGANAVKDLYLTDLMRQFESDLPNFKFVPTVAEPEPGESWDGQTGLVTEALQANLKNAPRFEAYLCGSPGMIDAAIKVLNDLGMLDENIFFDKFE